MPIIEVTMHTVRCDTCGEVFDDGEGGTLFPTVADVVEAVRAYGWNVIADEYLCPTRDEAHQAAIDRAMPPEPSIPALGQLAFDCAGLVRPGEETTP
jgi:nicotinamidase-related amidase